MKLMIKKAIILLMAALVILTGCNQTEYVESNRIIEAADLVDLFSDANTVVIDARSAKDYREGHLDGAINLSANDLTVGEPFGGILADAETVAAVLGANGISNDSNVFIYDDSLGVYASRIWWVMTVYGHDNVKVVNGGASAIVKAFGKDQMTASETTLEATTYTTKALDETTYASMDDVQAMIDGNLEGCLIDVRSQSEYDEGYIPTAILYPHSKNVYTDGTFKSTRDTYLDYNDLGVSKDETIILYCKSSFRATQTAIVLLEAGYEDVRIYDGAYLEWTFEGKPVENNLGGVAPSAQDAS